MPSLIGPNLDADLIRNLTAAAYVIASILFILGLKRLSSLGTALNGNRLASIAMLIAVVVTLLNRQIVTAEWIIVGLIVGSAIGFILSRNVQMTAMPQLVALFNGFGGAASALVAASEFFLLTKNGSHISEDISITVMASVIIGAVTLTGSFIALGKLQGLITTQPILIPARNYLNLIVFLGAVTLAVWLILEPDQYLLFFVLVSIALILGLLLVIPIGGADMPVVIALLNAYSGIAAAATGFVLGNTMLIIAGSLVGASGIILTRIMTKAMNRSLANVMLGGFGVQSQDSASGSKSDRPVRSVTAEDVSLILTYARQVIFVPGYGLAVAQAQHAIREIADELKLRGITVKYAIHPVAGRMPGHMNVLLAEANVPYDELKDLDQVNSEFERTDVVLVIGANDVTNPAARNDPSSPIYGMPILNVDKADAVVVLKRSMASGFSGVDNELFYLDKTMMFFGDARDSIENLLKELKDL